MRPIFTLNLEFDREFFDLADTVAYIKRLVKDRCFKLGSDTRYYTIDEVDRVAYRFDTVKTITIYKPIN